MTTSSAGEALRALEAAGHDAAAREAVEELLLALEELHPDVDTIVESVRQLARRYGGTLPLLGEAY